MTATATDWGTIWTAASAVATFLAAGVALWLGLASFRQAERIALLHAEIVAAKLVAQLSPPAARLDELVKVADFPIDAVEPHSVDIGEQKRAWLAAINQYRDVCNHPAFQVSDADISALMPLPSHCSARLAQATATLHSLAREMDRLLISPDQKPAKFDLAQHVYRLAVREMSLANRHLEIVLRVCRKAASKGAPPVSGHELYGDW